MVTSPPTWLVEGSLPHTGSHSLPQLSCDLQQPSCLHGKGSRWNRRLRRRRARPVGRSSAWECRAAQRHEARPEEAQEPSWGAAQRGALTMRPCIAEVQSVTMLTWLG